MTQEEPPLIIESRWDIPFRHTAGRLASHFFRALQEKRILALRCPRCRRVLLPPRPFCERCFVLTDEWVPLEDTGTLDTFTIVYEQFLGMPPPPYCVGMITLDGADTALMHYVSGVDLSDLEKAKQNVHVGMKVQAVWKEEREGRISDIRHFKPA